MHKARHSAGQRVLDHTGNLKAVQKLLGHTVDLRPPGTSMPTGMTRSWRPTMASVLRDLENEG